MLRPETAELLRLASIALDDAAGSLGPAELLDPQAEALRDLARDADRLWRELVDQTVDPPT